jgi:enoyl-CoA hydratase/carnithine racemase
MPSTIQLSRLANVEYVTLNRPEVRNAFNEHLIAELTAWAERAAADSGLRAVVFTGAGPTFCAGADLAWMAKMAGYSREDNLADARAAAAMFAAIDRPHPGHRAGSWAALAVAPASSPLPSRSFQRTPRSALPK